MHTDNFSLTAHPRSGADTPSSSVFDLPIHSGGPLAERSRTATGKSSSAPLDHPTAATSFIVISGGTGCNSICSAFGGSACYILPVSDDGGSSSEIIRVLGGPSIGDIRSRLIRLIPPAPTPSPLDSIRNLLAYRLPADKTEREARELWRDIVEGRSALWVGIPNDRKEMIRGFLVHFESEILKHAHKNFSFVNGSIGNYFLSAAQAFFRSLPSAIFLFSSITNSQANILPVIVTNHTVTIAAELENGGKLVGQCEISHPVRSGPRIDVSNVEDDEPEDEASDSLDGTISQRRNVTFQADGKHQYEPLGSKITRLYYINAYGNEIHPAPNPEYITNLRRNDVLVYSCGSLWTSIIPCLALKGVAGAIASSRSLRAKVLLLNSANDRETDGYTAVDYVQTIVRTLNARYANPPYGGLGKAETTYPVSAFITHLVYLKGTTVDVNVRLLTILGVMCVEVEGTKDERSGLPQFGAECVSRAIGEILEAVPE